MFQYRPMFAPATSHPEPVSAPVRDVPAYRPMEFQRAAHDYVLYIFVYNERVLVEKLLERVARVTPRRFDIMFGDDGSTDGSSDRRFLERFGVRGVTRLERNGGLSANIKAALDWLEHQPYKGVILINGNNRDNPATIPNFIEKLDQGYGYVQGSRFRRGGRHVNTPWIRYAAIRFVHAPLFSLSSGKWMTDTTNGYRAFSHAFLTDPRVSAFQPTFRKYEIEQYLACKAIRLGYRATEVPVERSYPVGGYTSHIKPGLGWVSMLSPLFGLLFRRYD